MAKYRIVQVEDGPKIYQAQVWDGSVWLFQPGTTEYTAEKCEALLRKEISFSPKVIKELEL